MSEKTIRIRTVFRGRLLKIQVVDVRLAGGRRSVREIVVHPGATAILCRRMDGRFIFVRQYRKPVEKQLLEIVAGTLERGESPARCAVREVKEETGYSVTKLRKLGVIFLAPGYTTERLHVYQADLHCARGVPNPDADENVRTVCFTRREVETLIRQGKIMDSKTLAAWILWKSMTAARRPK
jgi:ADP-ribose pyrophosphatase